MKIDDINEIHASLNENDNSQLSEQINDSKEKLNESKHQHFGESKIWRGYDEANWS